MQEAVTGDECCIRCDAVGVRRLIAPGARVSGTCYSQPVLSHGPIQIVFKAVPLAKRVLFHM
jgi:hypothetical protein